MPYIKNRTPDMHKMTILWDDRERNPWKLPIPFKMVRKRLETADYTIEGYEDIIAIEKKSGILELLGNLSGKNRDRFEKFLVRLSKFPYKVIVVEDDYSACDLAFAILKKKSKGRACVTPASLQCWMWKIQIQYGIPMCFIGPPDMRSSTDMTLAWLFKMAYEQAFNYRGKR